MEQNLNSVSSAGTKDDSNNVADVTTSAPITPNPMLAAGWYAVTETPPDELVKVIDKNGRKGFAYPTYYPFKVSKSNGGKWTSSVIPCEPYWDGGWMIAVSIGNLTSNLEEIVGWRHY